jgi:membrane protein YqaA with SNARE-associated domain
VSEHLGALDGITSVNTSFDVLSDEEKSGLKQKLGRGSLPAGALAQVGRVICIASGKGGVGKSTLTANLASALAAEGRRVGVLDADVWGYSQPRMFGLGAERPKVNGERKIIPHESHGVKVMSIGFFLAESVGRWIVDLYHLSHGIEGFREAYAKWGVWIILIKGLTPIPYKLVTIASGMAAFSLPVFVVASIITRGARFTLVAWLFQKYGPAIAPVIERRIGLIMAGVAVAVVLGVIAVMLIG